MEWMIYNESVWVQRTWTCGDVLNGMGFRKQHGAGWSTEVTRPSQSGSAIWFVGQQVTSTNGNHAVAPNSEDREAVGNETSQTIRRSCRCKACDSRDHTVVHRRFNVNRRSKEQTVLATADHHAGVASSVQ
jgi:Tfp pilus assembly major pilin PilA